VPEITLTLTDDEYQRLVATAQARDQPSPEEAALFMIRRDMWKPPRDKSSDAYKGRQGDRLARQIAVTTYIKERGVPVSVESRRALQDQLGVSTRTLYRDIEIALDALGRTEEIKSTLGGRPPAPPKRAGGRHRRQSLPSTVGA
jgi:hypothetical protein